MTQCDTLFMRVWWGDGMALTGETSRCPYWITTVCIFFSSLCSDHPLTLLPLPKVIITSPEVRLGRTYNVLISRVSLLPVHSPLSS